jgi:hypothetical protein
MWLVIGFAPTYIAMELSYRIAKGRTGKRNTVMVPSGSVWAKVRTIGIIRMVTMTLVDVLSIGIGSAIILGLLGSIAIEGLRRGKNSRKVITTIDNEWHKNRA